MTGLAGAEPLNQQLYLKPACQAVGLFHVPLVAHRSHEPIPCVTNVAEGNCSPRAAL
jgi:hypothetical protein